jgi:phosphatidylserine synthase
MRNYYNNTTTSFHEVEIIRRHFFLGSVFFIGGSQIARWLLLINKLPLFIYNQKLNNMETPMLVIACILGIAMVLNINEKEGNYNVLMAIALLIALYNLNFIVFVFSLIILVLIGLSYAVKDK